LIFLSATNLSQNASACECEDLKERTSYLINSDSIFSGRVKSVEKTDDKPSSYNVRFDVDKVWKGPEAKEIAIKSSLDTGLCGYLFEINQTLVVHAFNEGGILNEKGCGTLSVEYVADYIKFLDSIMQDNTEWKTLPSVGKYLYNEPQRPAQIFNVQYMVVNGTLNSIISINGSYSIEASTVKENGLFELKIPLNYPYTNFPNVTIGQIYVVMINNENVGHIFGPSRLDECFFGFSIPFSGNVHMDLAPGVIPEHFPYHGDEVPPHCIKETILSIPPLQQLKSGISANDVVCKESFELIFKSKDGSPACVKPASLTKLVAWGWAKPSGPP